jgi:hypothetical protein
MTEVEFDHLLSKFRRSAARLNEESDSINEIIASVERQLVEANAGFECWATPFRAEPERCYDNGDDNEGHLAWTETLVGFAKLEDAWRLAVKEREARKYNDEDRPTYSYDDPFALSQASRSIRVAALGKLPELIEALSTKADSAVELIGRAKRLVK